MKRFLALGVVLILALSVISCKTDEQKMLEFAVETAAMVAGQLVAKEGITITPTMNEYYQMVISGNFELNAEEYARIQTYLANELGLNALIVNRIMALGEMVGVELSGEIVDLEGVNMDLVKAAFNGFMLGMTMNG